MLAPRAASMPARRHVDVVFSGVLLAVHLVATVCFLSLTRHGGAGDVVLATVQSLGRGAVFIGLFGLCFDGLRPGVLRSLVAGLAFFLFASEIVDFLLYVNSGNHLTYLVRVLWSGGVHDLWDLITATRLSRFDLVWILGLAPALVATGALIARVTTRLSARFGVRFSRHAVVLLGGALVALAEQGASRRYKTHKFYVSEREVFGYYIPVIPPASDVRFPVRLKLTRDETLDEREIARAAGLPRPPSSKHVFFVVLESVRAGYVTPETAPHMTAFAADNFRFRSAHSSSNATVNSWHSMFHAHHAAYWWPYTRRTTYPGATALRIVKALGHEVTLVSSSDLEYHQYEKSIFGDGFRLVDRRIDTSVRTRTHPAEGDREAIEKLSEALPDMKATGKPQFVAVLLESGHHDYYWPADEPAPFSPYIDRFDYTRVRYTDADLERVKNRYRNAIHFQDRLVGRLVGRLKELGMYDDSLIVLVGDHGEEFLEKGRLAHSSNLFEPQTTPVFLMRLPGKPASLRDERVSHVQVMPTILADLGYEAPRGLFDGLPIGAPGASELQLVSKARIPSAPYIYVMHTGGKKLFFELESIGTPESKWLYATAVTGDDDEDQDPEGPGRKATLDALFRPALAKLPFVEVTGPLE